jgi:hypothetical protein
MANRYWVGGTGTWTTTTTNWSATSGGAGGASAPTAADSVFFDQAGTYTVTLTGALACLDITVSAGTVTFSGAGTMAISGSMSLSASTVWSATSVLTFNATTTGKTITTNGITINGTIVFSGVGGEWTLGSALVLGVTNATTLTAGSLVLNGFNLTTGVFSSSNTNTRSIAFGTNFIILRTSTASSANIAMATATGFTWTGTTGGFSTNMSVARTFTFGTTGGSTTNAPNFYITGGASEANITTGSWFNIFDCTGSTCTISGATAGSGTILNVRSIVLATGGTYTNFSPNMTGTGTIAGNSKTLFSLSIEHSGTTTLSSALTVANGTTFGTTTTPTLNLNGFDLTTGSFSSSSATVRSIVFGSNYIITTASGVSMANATNFTYTGTGGFKGNMAAAQTFTFGTTGGSASNAINLLIYTGATAASLTTGSWFNIVDCTGSTGIVGTTSTTTATIINVNSLILASGANATTAYGWLQANMYGTTSTINGQGKSIYTFTIQAGTTTTLASALGCTALYTQATDTTLALSTFTLTPAVGFTYIGGTLTMNTGTISTTTFTLNGPTFTLNSGTINCSTSFVVTSGSFTLGASGTLGATPTFTQTAGSVTFAKNYSLSATTSTYNFTSGTLDLGGFTLNVGRFVSSNANTRSIAFGSGRILLSYSTTATVNLSMANATNFTWTGTGGFSADMTALSIARTFIFGTTGGSAANAPNLYITAGASEVNITTGSWFNIFDCTGSTSTVSGAATGSVTNLNLTNLTLGSGTYTNLTATLVASGSIYGNSKSIAALSIATTITTTLTSALTVVGATDFGTVTSSPTLNLGGFDLTTGSFNSGSGIPRTVIFGSNYIITTTSGVAIADATDFTWTGTGGFKGNMTTSPQTFTFGTTGASELIGNPINLLIYTGAQAATLGTNSWFNKVDCTGSTGIVGTTSTVTAKTINVKNFNIS